MQTAEHSHPVFHGWVRSSPHPGEAHRAVNIASGLHRANYNLQQHGSRSLVLGGITPETMTPGAKGNRCPDRRIRSGICTLWTAVAMLVLSLAAVMASTASEGLSREYAGAVTEATYLLEGLDIEMESGLLQPKQAQVGQATGSVRVSKGLRRTRGTLEADVANSGSKCEKNPTSARRVDPADYEYGCREIEEMLGGNFTQVSRKGGVRTVLLVEYGGRKLAVKPLIDMKRLSQHHREVVTLDALRGHENVVGMLGLCDTTVVTDFVADSFSRVISRDDKELPTRRLLSLAIDAAKGLQALHEIAGGIHMDMNPSQLLITETGRAELNDFNSVHLLSIAPGDQQTFCPSRNHKPGSGRNPWRAPEWLAMQPLTEKADIFSLGMTFYAVVAGKPPYDSVESLKVAHENKTRPKIDARWHGGFMEIVKDMWSESPEDRPSARQVVARLQDLLGDLDGRGDR